MPDRPTGQIRAAGAVVWQRPADGNRIALVHRRRYGDWSFPKGKQEPGEHLLMTAVREVAEETGLAVILGRPLGAACYDSGGRPKRVHYWSGRSSVAPGPFAANAEVDDLQWLTVPAARQRLTYPRDVEVLDNLAAGPAWTIPLIFLRHAEAGSRAGWPDDDLARPLDARGVRAAQALAQVLSCLGRCRVISSAAERCVATVRPYAAEVGVPVEAEPLFTLGPLGADQAAGAAAAERAAGIAAAGAPVLICAHRENLPELLDAACTRLGSGPPAGRPLGKGAFWVLQSADQALASAEQHCAPQV